MSIGERLFSKLEFCVEHNKPFTKWCSTVSCLSNNNFLLCNECLDDHSQKNLKPLNDINIEKILGFIVCLESSQEKYIQSYLKTIRRFDELQTALQNSCNQNFVSSNLFESKLVSAVLNRVCKKNIPNYAKIKERLQTEIDYLIPKKVIYVCEIKNLFAIFALDFLKAYHSSSNYSIPDVSSLIHDKNIKEDLLTEITEDLETHLEEIFAEIKQEIILDLESSFKSFQKALSSTVNQDVKVSSAAKAVNMKPRCRTAKTTKINLHIKNANQFDNSFSQMLPCLLILKNVDSLLIDLSSNITYFIDPKSLRPLKAMKQLQHLLVKMSHGNFQVLKDSLRYLLSGIGGNRLTTLIIEISNTVQHYDESEHVTLAQLISRSPKLTNFHFDLSYLSQGIFNNDLIVILNALQTAKNLRILKLDFEDGRHHLLGYSAVVLCNTLKSLKYLEEIYLDFGNGENRFGDTELIALGEVFKVLKCLKGIRVFLEGKENMVTSDGIISFLKNIQTHKIRMLKLFVENKEYNFKIDKVVRHLHDFDGNLEILSLKFASQAFKFEHKELVMLANKIKHFSNLSNLYINFKEGECEFDNKAFEAYCNAVKHLEKLKSLTLIFRCASYVDDTLNMRAFANSVKKLASLEFLDFYINHGQIKIDNDGLVHFSDAVKTMKNMKRLYLNLKDGEHSVDDVSFGIFVIALTNLENLIDLRLNFEAESINITDKSFTILSSSLHYLKCLENVKLVFYNTNSKIKVSAACELITTLLDCPGMRAISLNVKGRNLNHTEDIYNELMYYRHGINLKIHFSS